MRTSHACNFKDIWKWNFQAYDSRPKADYDPEMLQSPIKAGLKQALAFPTKFSFCIQQGNIAFQNDISQKTVRLEVLSWGREKS